jgi:four helix bundle protein
MPREFADHAPVTLLQLPSAMAGFKKFEDIIAWQLAYKLKVDVDVFLNRPDFRRRFKFHDQLHDAVRSGPRNIAEGHMRGFKHREFARFVRIARGSEGEVLNHLLDAHDQRLISATELEAASRLAKRAIKAASNLIRYLESTPDPAPPPYKPSDQ